MKSGDDIYSQQRAESTEWNMFNLVIDGLPGQVQNRIRQMAGARTIFTPDTSSQPSPSEPPKTLPDEPSNASKEVEPPSDRPCAADRQAAELTASTRRGLFSRVTAMAATVKTPSPSPDRGSASGRKGLRGPPASQWYETNITHRILQVVI